MEGSACTHKQAHSHNYYLCSAVDDGLGSDNILARPAGGAIVSDRVPCKDQTLLQTWGLLVLYTLSLRNLVSKGVTLSPVGPCGLGGARGGCSWVWG